MRYLAVIAALCSGPVAAEPPVMRPYDGSFEDAGFAVESAILNRGLVIDYVSHVGDMLNRTGVDVGDTSKIFEAADIYLFCSAQLSRRVMAADPDNIQHCPYAIFVTAQDGDVMIGHRAYPEGAMQEIEAVLADITEEARAF